MGKRKRNGNNSVNRRRMEKKGRAGTAVNRCYKDTVFRMLFREKDELLGLYNAVGGKQYTDPEKLEIVTLENAVYMGMKNDLAFLIDFNLYLYEHQSTINQNMPLRFLQYVTAEYSRLTASDNLYGEKMVKIPTPHFVIFYNGIEPCSGWSELKLSEAYEAKEDTPELELRVQVLNINEGYNEELKRQCRALAEYMQYVDRVRSYARELPLESAVDRAVDECIGQGVLKEFLLKNKAEVKRMSIFEYDEEAARSAIRRDAYERGAKEGRQDGRQQSILQLLEDIGFVPPALREEILAESDEEVLKQWLKIAAHAERVEDFWKKLKPELKISYKTS